MCLQLFVLFLCLLETFHYFLRRATVLVKLDVPVHVVKLLSQVKVLSLEYLDLILVYSGIIFVLQKQNRSYRSLKIAPLKTVGVKNLLQQLRRVLNQSRASDYPCGLDCLFASE